MSDVTIQQWGDVWHAQADDGATTTGSFADAVMWACGDLSPGEGEVTIRWGIPLMGDRYTGGRGQGDAAIDEIASSLPPSHHDQDDVIGFCADYRHPHGCQDEFLKAEGGWFKWSGPIYIVGDEE